MGRLLVAPGRMNRLSVILRWINRMNWTNWWGTSRQKSTMAMTRSYRKNVTCHTPGSQQYWTPTRTKMTDRHPAGQYLH
jgi:hypothetical protein